MSINNIRNISPNTTTKRLIHFIEKALMTFTSSNIFKTRCIHINKSKPSENSITSALREYLDMLSRENLDNIFYFETQAEQKENESQKGSSRSVDIAISTNKSDGHYIFCLEAKKIKNYKNYINSDIGAIKRFKNCDHGLSSPNPDNRKLLPENGIVGYSSIKNFQKHFDKINEKIESLSKDFASKQDEFGLNWYDTELLQKQDNTKNYISHHKRTTGENLTIHHFWVFIEFV